VSGLSILVCNTTPSLNRTASSSIMPFDWKFNLDSDTSSLPSKNTTIGSDWLIDDLETLVLILSSYEKYRIHSAHLVTILSLMFEIRRSS
jgi:hypothetical protein